VLFGDMRKLPASARVDVSEHARERLLRIIPRGCKRSGTDSLVEYVKSDLDTPAGGCPFVAGAGDMDVARTDRVAVGAECSDQARGLALDVPVATEARNSETCMHGGEFCG
jgi:hypothetical protein